MTLVVIRTLPGEMSATNAKHQNQMVQEVGAAEDMVVAVVVVAEEEEVLEIVVVEIVAVGEVEDLEADADLEGEEIEEVVVQ